MSNVASKTEAQAMPRDTIITSERFEVTGNGGMMFQALASIPATPKTVVAAAVIATMCDWLDERAA